VAPSEASGEKGINSPDSYGDGFQYISHLKNTPTNQGRKQLHHPPSTILIDALVFKNLRVCSYKMLAIYGRIYGILLPVMFNSKHNTYCHHKCFIAKPNFL
jgi:hypothetical protein